MKIACFHDFYAKNQFLLIFYTQNANFSIFKVVPTLWRQSNVIHYEWYSFWYQWKEDIHSYNGSKFRVIWLIVVGGGCFLRKIYLRKMLRRTRVKGENAHHGRRWDKTQGGRTSLPKFQFSAKYPIGMHLRTTDKKSKLTWIRCENHFKQKSVGVQPSLAPLFKYFY